MEDEKAIEFFESQHPGPVNIPSLGDGGPVPEAIAEEAVPTTPTALVKIDPETDQGFQSLLSETLGLLKYAERRTIITPDDVKVATDDLAIMATLKKAIDLKRTEYIGPLNDHVKAVNTSFKTITEPLGQADAATRLKIQAWRQDQERLRRAAEEVQRLQDEAAAARAKLAQDLGEPLPEVEVLPALDTPAAPPAHVYTDMGTLGKATIWKFEVIDFSLLPDRFKMENATLIGKVVRAGEREIPGVRIWCEDSLRVTPK